MDAKHKDVTNHLASALHQAQAHLLEAEKRGTQVHIDYLTEVIENLNPKQKVAYARR